MPRARQPTTLLEANGRKHLTRAEADERRDREVRLAPPDTAEPPQWLPKKLHGEFGSIGELLLRSGLYTELDRDTLAMYFLARDRFLSADKRAAKAIREKDEKAAREWSGVTSAYFKQARQCAEAMGMSVSSRCRLVVPAGLGGAAGEDNGDDEFTAALRSRQGRAVNG